MKKILGLDLGTNSIGWALINYDVNNESGQTSGSILASGSRIIPMTKDVMDEFGKGNPVSKTAERTSFRGIRRLRERHLLRRERLHRVLNKLGFLPEHYRENIDFNIHFGKFFPGKEPKLSYNTNEEKSEFLFLDSFNEMLNDFKISQPEMLTNKNGERALIPHDWTIYYLRKKALSKKIEKEELAWLLLNFNQKRGYYQLRGEDETENDLKVSEFFALKVTDVIPDTGNNSKSKVWYSVKLENGWIYRRESETSLSEWIGKTKEFIVSWELNEDKTIKTDKDGNEKRSFKAVDSDIDWIAIKKSTEEKIERSNKTVGEYIYDSILKNPSQKVKGKLIRVIERKYYKKELEMIMEKQKEFHTELNNEKLFKICLEELYNNNESHRNGLEKKDFTHLFLNDIIFYQRPLKSKKSTISNCKFESRVFIKDGKPEISYIKCIAKSHPLYQEFRLWQFIQNLRIYEKEKSVDGKLFIDFDVTKEFLGNDEKIVELYEKLNNIKEVDQKAFFKLLGLKKEAENFRWNYVEEKLYPCNETRSLMLQRLKKIENLPENFLTKEKETELWHILYSVTDRNELFKALNTFGKKNNLGNDFTEAFIKFPPFKSDYGSYSYKAINKFLPLMRIGKYWIKKDIDNKTLDRINKIIAGEYDESIKDRVRDKAFNISKLENFQALPTWLVSYIVYDRHSEDVSSTKWNKAMDIQRIPQHSLRNPIVEQILNETLMVVKDIWLEYGNGDENFFDEIHVELGREMKNPADKRKRMTNQMNENENTNLRIKALLMELLNDKEIENIRPYSPMQQEILKIYEEGALNSANGDLPDEIKKISKLAQPSSSDLIKYKLWLEQKYRSPYTGEIISLSKLFTRDYDIEHIIPQSRYFDDSFSNKVICEVEINTDKSNNTAYEYIKNNSGKKIELNRNKVTNLFTIDQFEEFVKKNYGETRGKLKKLLMEDIPDSFIERQLNDTRYISKVVKNLLSNIVREKDEMETVSKNVIVTNGQITSELKQNWELNNVWNQIITPRFERLNKMTNSNNFGEWTIKDGKKVFQINVPFELQKGFSKKRIDHRHHALDAIVVACTSRSHINYLNNESALEKGNKEKKRFDLKNKLCYKKYTDDSKQHYNWIYKKPWDGFTDDTFKSISQIIVSFKQNLRVINKTVNRYQKYIKNEEGEFKKATVKQTKGDNWAIRKPLHKDTVSGLIAQKFSKTISLSNALDNPDSISDKNLRNKILELYSDGMNKDQILKFFKAEKNVWNEKDISKIQIFYFDEENVASRKKIDISYNSDKIEKITDTGIQKIMLNHLKKYDENINGKLKEHPELAFSEDGIEEMNKSIFELNGNIQHKPIFKVRTSELKGKKFQVGFNGNKMKKYVEAAKGTNLFFAIYHNEDGKRSYETIPLNIVIEQQKQGLFTVPEQDENGNKISFYLSPDDLVIIPDYNQKFDSLNLINKGDFSDKFNVSRNIYRMVSSTKGECHFIPYYVSSPIIGNIELGTNNKSEKAWDGKVVYRKNSKNKEIRTDSGSLIKEVCKKLKINRLGKIIID
ncbi:MAG: type II CRISPR RNA-guided endonuclease Cas9 [Ignavibacteria bacterium]